MKKILTLLCVFMLGNTFCYCNDLNDVNALLDIVVHCEDTLNKNRQKIDQIIDALYPLTQPNQHTEGLQVAASLYLSLAIQQKQTNDYNQITSRRQLHDAVISQIDYWSETQYSQ